MLPGEIEAVYEALRGGRVPASGLAMLATGIDDIVAELDETVAHVGGGQSAFRFVRGGFGAGKTFVARYTQERARAAGFATAWLVVSETELRLWKPDDLYHGIASSLQTADVAGNALVDLVDRWISRIEDRVEASSISVDSPGFDAAVEEAMTVELAASGNVPVPMARALVALRKARDAGDGALQQGLLAWLSGSRQVDAAVKRKAGLKGDIIAREAIGFVRGLATLVRLAGYGGMVVVIDELETILRTPRTARSRTLNALRQLSDAVDSMPGVLWLVTGTPELFDSPAGVAGLPPLHDRIQLLSDGDRTSLDQPQIVLPRFNEERLRAVAAKVIAHYPARRADFDRDAQHAWVDPLIAWLARGFGGRVDIVPRRFVRELVFRLDLVDHDPTYDPATSLTGAKLRPEADEALAIKASGGRVASAPNYLEEDVW